MKRLTLSLSAAVFVFFAVFFLGRNILISALCAVIVYVCFFILFAPKEDKSLSALDTVDTIKGGLGADDSVHYYRDMYLTELSGLKRKITSESIGESIGEILLKANSILDFVIDHPAEYPEIRGFMDNYLPATIKILKNYADVQNSALEAQEKDEFKNKIEPFLGEIEDAFSRRLKELYDNKLTDSNIEMETLKKTLIMEGLLDKNDFDEFM